MMSVVGVVLAFGVAGALLGALMAAEARDVVVANPLDMVLGGSIIGAVVGLVVSLALL